MLKAIQIIGSSSGFVSNRLKSNCSHGGLSFSSVSTKQSSSSSIPTASLMLPLAVPARQRGCFRPFNMSAARAESNSVGASSSSSSSPSVVTTQPSSAGEADIGSTRDSNIRRQSRNKGLCCSAHSTIRLSLLRTCRANKGWLPIGTSTCILPQKRIRVQRGPPFCFNMDSLWEVMQGFWIQVTNHWASFLLTMVSSPLTVMKERALWS